jgi:membrane associated rhomboid family serine protease
MSWANGHLEALARNLRQLKSAPISWATASLVLAIHGVVVAAGGPHQQPVGAWFVALGMTRPEVLGGEIWRIFSYGLLHANGWHVVTNALFVLFIGSRIEHIAGRSVMVKTVIYGILGGGVGHLILAPSGPAAPLLVGLSGGGVGLLLLLTTLSPQSRMLPFPISGRSLGLAILGMELTSALIDPALKLPFFSTLGQNLVNQGLGSFFQLGHACHFGGGMVGWLMGRWLLRPRVTLKSLRAVRKRREASDFKSVN